MVSGAEWARFFDGLADFIVDAFAPGTALDVGCGTGLLVDALRARGVDARGVDASAEAIAQVPERLRPYCAVGSLTDPIEGDYDLIACLDVLEHVDPEETERAFDELTAHTGRILVSWPADASGDGDARPSDDWTRALAGRGFVPSPTSVAALRGRLESFASRSAQVDPPSFREVRKQVAARFLTGSGLEIGALHEPLEVPEGVHVRYVDRKPIEALTAEFPELTGTPFVAPDIVDDGESLSSIPDASVDFVVANHFIEHCQDPIGTLEHHLRVLRDGGILYLAVPDKRQTFDATRPVTRLDHLLADHVEGPAASRWDHFLEYAIAAKGLDAAAALDLAERDQSIHFHVWTPDAFREILDYCRSQLALPFEILALEPNDFEFVVVLRRTGHAAD